jgi:predicted nucleic acid-binding protein
LILLDTSVLSYAVGEEHPLRDPSRRMIEAAASRADRITTTIEVIQEFTHVRSRRYPRANAVSMARSYIDLLSPLIQIDADDLDLGLKLYERHESLGAFDAVLAAVALSLGAEALVSGDAAFGSVPKLRFVSLDSAELDELLS